MPCPVVTAIFYLYIFPFLISKVGERQNELLARNLHEIFLSTTLLLSRNWAPAQHKVSNPQPLLE